MTSGVLALGQFVERATNDFRNGKETRQLNIVPVSSLNGCLQLLLLVGGVRDLSCYEHVLLFHSFLFQLTIFPLFLVVFLFCILFCTDPFQA